MEQHPGARQALLRDDRASRAELTAADHVVDFLSHSLLTIER
jgi:hypothetical protein